MYIYIYILTSCQVGLSANSLMYADSLSVFHQMFYKLVLLQTSLALEETYIALSNCSLILLVILSSG